MPDLRELYQEVVVDHSRRPRNFRRIEGPSRSARGYNPLCGDKVNVYVKFQDGRVADVSFEGSGCAISTASASIMTEVVKGKTVEEAEALFQGFHDLVTTGSPSSSLGKLAVFSNVSDYPARVKCATLVWHTLHSALQGEETIVSTE
jgi:nitrogen fixation protein NifU and related proteins